MPTPTDHDSLPRIRQGELRRLGLPGELSVTAWALPDTLSEAEWWTAGAVLGRLEASASWWIGDWWAFGETHYGDRKALTDSPDWHGPAYQTCRNCASVSRTFETSRRRDVLSFSHHADVAALAPDVADRMLDWCEEPLHEGERWPRSTRDLRAAIKNERRTAWLRSLRLQNELPFGERRYSTIVIDPPWQMEKIEREVRPNQVGFDYPTMTEEELAAFDVPRLALDHCHLFCWTTQKFLPSALRLIGDWGFEYVLTMVWHKPGGYQPYGLPQYNCEFIVYARQGAPQFIDTTAFDCCFTAPRREHSRKPDEFYDLVRRVTAAPRIDVFSREPRDGFDQHGNETQKFAVPA